MDRAAHLRGLVKQEQIGDLAVLTPTRNRARAAK